MNRIERIRIAPADARNGNIYLQYDIEKNKTAWIWYPRETPPDVPISHGQQIHCIEKQKCGGLVEFKNTFTLEEDIETVLHISADNRFEASLDGEFFGAGPDRCDLNHWSFGSYKVKLEKGTHTLSVLCWHFRADLEVPSAQFSFNPGFILGCSAPEHAKIFNTGVAEWLVRKYDGLSFQGFLLPNDNFWRGAPITHYSVISADRFFQQNEYKKAEIVLGPFWDNHGGSTFAGPKLFPSDLPEQLRVFNDLKGCTVRAVFRNSCGLEVPVTDEHMSDPAVAAWQEAIDNGAEMVVPANSELAVLVDLNDYYCGFAAATLDGGDSDSLIRMVWAESLYNEKDTKDDRGKVHGKKFCQYSNGNIFNRLDGSEHDFRTLWWCAGRYLLLHFKSGAAPIKVRKIGFIESRYPMEMESSITFPDNDLNRVIPMMFRGLQMCSHETYMDCPYYEQLMYVGDTRLECLATYVTVKDHRLPKRAVDLFNWSRSDWDGMVAERYPCCGPQLSCTFSMIWTYMLKDYHMYRGLEQKDLLALRDSVRNMIHILHDQYTNEAGLIEHLPGWSFVDWVRGWGGGRPNSAPNGSVTAIYNLFYLGAVKTAMELEEEGSHLQLHFKDLYERAKAAIIKAFYEPENHLFADDLEHTRYSRHAQCLALFFDALEGDEAIACLDQTMTRTDLAEPTIYFSHYLFETLGKFGRGGEIADRMNIWLDQVDLGATTPWECPEPSRSDCHAWGAHPLFHYYATIAGIRPASPGFKTVRIAPQLGRLPRVEGKMVHPAGFIAFDLKNQSGVISGKITLPDGITGEFVQNGTVKALNPGENVI